MCLNPFLPATDEPESHVSDHNGETRILVRLTLTRIHEVPGDCVFIA